MQWKPSKINFAYRLGTIEIANIPLKVVVPLTHPIEFGPHSAEKPPRQSMKDAHASVAVLASCPVTAPLKRLSWRDGSFRYVRGHFPHYYIDITGDFESYLNTWNKQSRKQTRRAVRRYEEKAGGTLPFRVYKEPGEVEEFITLAGELSLKTFQHRLLNRGLPTSQDFVDQVHALAKEDRFRGYILNDFDNKAPVAFLYAPAVAGARGDVIISDIGGFDPEYKDHSPGSVLRYQVIQGLFEDKRFRFYDLSEGEGSHKHRLATHHFDCAEVYFFEASIPNAMIVASHFACETVSVQAARLLDSLGVKERVSRALRRR